MEKSLGCWHLKKPCLLVAGLVVSSVLLLSGLFQLNPLRDAVTMLPSDGFSLHMGWLYIAFAPLWNILDTVSFLSSSQHAAVILWFFVVPILMVLWQMRQASLSWFQRLFQFTKAIAFSLVLLILLYAMAVLMPRPMGALQAPDTAMLLVDFHSHTNHSWDANSFFTAEKNRKWHEKAGFDAAFITDHQSFIGAEEAKQANPTHAADGLLLLSGLEEVYKGSHVMALCADTSIYKVSKTGCKPLFIQANPSHIEDLAITHADGEGVLGIEIHDAAPVGLEGIAQRDVWLKQARKFDVAVVYGSDNHGWGFAASGWSVLRIPQWQGLNADTLEIAITNHIRQYGFTSVQVIERHLLLPATTWLGHVTMPAQLLWRMLRSLSWAERLSWLLWLCLVMGMTYHSIGSHTYAAVKKKHA